MWNTSSRKNISYCVKVMLSRSTSMNMQKAVRCLPSQVGVQRNPISTSDLINYGQNFTSILRTQYLENQFLRLPPEDDSFHIVTLLQRPSYRVAMPTQLSENLLGTLLLDQLTTISQKLFMHLLISLSFIQEIILSFVICKVSALDVCRSVCTCVLIRFSTMQVLLTSTSTCV